MVNQDNTPNRETPDQSEEQQEEYIPDIEPGIPAGPGAGTR